jgi:hypothetical protein
LRHCSLSTLSTHDQGPEPDPERESIEHEGEAVALEELALNMIRWEVEQIEEVEKMLLR